MLHFSAWPLKLKLALLTALTLALGMGGLAAGVVRQLRDDYGRMVFDQQKTAVDFVARSLDHELRLRLDALLAVAPDMAVRLSQGEPAVQAGTEHLRGLQSLFRRDVYVLDRQGQRVAEVPMRHHTGTSYADTSYFVQVMRSGTAVVEPLHRAFCPSTGDHRGRTLAQRTGGVVGRAVRL